MTLRARRIIYLTFIFFFLIVTPVIILYAAGYRYNFQKHKIQKVGILVLKSKPDNAKIFLNNQLKKQLTPAKIINLLPGDYLIKIEKDDFHSWQKTLTVQSNLTTFAENVLLFKKNLPTKLLGGDIDFFAFSPNKQKIIYQLNQEAVKEIWLLNLKSSQNILLYRLSDQNIQTLNPEWSKDSQKFFVTLLNQKSKITKYLILDTQTQKATVYSQSKEFYLEFKNLNNKFFDTTQPENLIFIDSPSQFTTTLNKNNQELTVFENNFHHPIFQTKSDFAVWLKEEKKLLYLKNFEIWIYDFNTEQDILITRYSKEIKKALWINDNYILILLDNTLKIIELDERGERHVIDLLALEKIDDFDIDSKEQKIYFLGEIGNKKGIYEFPY